ncbi:hypothetical protein ACQEVS_14505 [Streptomyces sp. CA-181903]|uniref:hypothetical protein n=1 Tax=Streptomyces sp. CA-181903 TaxID=3240055 RepID=UPI003D8D779F
MAFNAAQYTATVDKLNSGLTTLTAKLNQVGPKAESTANKWYVPEIIGKALIWCANKLIELGKWILNKIGELLKGPPSPSPPSRTRTPGSTTSAGTPPTWPATSPPTRSGPPSSGRARARPPTPRP